MEFGMHRISYRKTLILYFINRFYITPEWERLAAPAVWGDASSQIFFSFSLAFGALVTFASYNKVSLFKTTHHEVNDLIIFFRSSLTTVTSMSYLCRSPTSSRQYFLDLSCSPFWDSCHIKCQFQSMKS